MKLKFDRKYLKKSLYAFFTIALVILFYQLLDNVSSIVDNVSIFLSGLRRLFSPVIIGIFVAYLLNPGVRRIECYYFRGLKNVKKKRKVSRILSIITVYLILIGFIVMVSLFIIPQISDNIADLMVRIPRYIDSTRQFVDSLTEKSNLVDIYNLDEHLKRIVNNLFSRTYEILEYLLENIFTSLRAITSGVLNFLLGIIISFYLLNEKESLKLGMEKITRALFSKNVALKIKKYSREADDIFSRFIVGRALDSFIIGCICLVGLLILRIKYSLLLSVIVGVTNMIPYFGPFIGGVPAVLITLFDSPINALWVGIFILVLQQFDGLILGPKILGDSLGIKPVWIIVSIIVGGKLYGVLGMFLAVPVFAILKLFADRILFYLLKKE